MQPIATDVVAWSVRRSVTTVSPANTAEMIEMLFWMWTRGSKEPCIRWGPDPPMGKDNFEGGKGGPL